LKDRDWVFGLGFERCSIVLEILDDQQSVPPRAEVVPVVTTEDVVFVNPKKREILQRFLDSATNRVRVGTIFHFHDQILVLIVCFGDDLEDDNVGTTRLISAVTIEVIARDIFCCKLYFVCSREFLLIFIRNRDERQVSIGCGIVVIEGNLFCHHRNGPPPGDPLQSS